MATDEHQTCQQQFFDNSSAQHEIRRFLSTNKICCL